MTISLLAQLKKSRKVSALNALKTLDFVVGCFASEKAVVEAVRQHFPQWISTPLTGSCADPKNHGFIAFPDQIAECANSMKSIPVVSVQHGVLVVLN